MLEDGIIRTRRLEGGLSTCAAAAPAPGAAAVADAIDNVDVGEERKEGFVDDAFDGASCGVTGGDGSGTIIDDDEDEEDDDEDSFDDCTARE